MGDCRLRPVDEADLDCFDAEFSDRSGTGEYQWFGFRSDRGLRRRFADSGLLELRTEAARGVETAATTPNKPVNGVAVSRRRGGSRRAVR